MILEQIILTNYRNFENKSISFHPDFTVISGKNAVGKTNILESIYVITHGSGFREVRSDELIQQNESNCIIEAKFIHNTHLEFQRIVIDNTTNIQKAYFINKVKKSLLGYVSFSPKTVVFSPALLYVIDGQPGERRNFFDKIISSVDIEYKKRLLNYEISLRKRNKLLEKEKNVEKLKEELVFWDNYLIDHATYITKKREELVVFFNNNPSLDKTLFAIRHQKNEISRESLDKTFEKQLFVKKTLVGPQRDDYEIDINKGKGVKNIHHMGSRSEQRLALFWLLTNELKIIETTLKQKPILLLDDIFSELDVENKSLIIKLITKYQTIITTTEEHIEDLIHLPHSIIKL